MGNEEVVQHLQVGFEAKQGQLGNWPVSVFKKCTRVVNIIVMADS